MKIATAIQAQMAEAGIRVEIEQVDSAAWTDMKKAGKVTCGIGDWKSSCSFAILRGAHGICPRKPVESDRGEIFNDWQRHFKGK